MRRLPLGAIDRDMGTKTRTRTAHHPEQKHPEEIKARVRMNGTTLAEISRRGGLNQEACSWALKHPWPRAERLIADAIGCEPCELWPDRYDRHGRPLRGAAVPSARRTKGAA